MSRLVETLLPNRLNNFSEIQIIDLKNNFVKNYKNLYLINLKFCISI